MGLFDKIKDVIGDIAPVVLPVAINAFLPGLGTVASGALGAGIGTLLQGGDAKDALKSAALGGGIGALKVGFLGKQGSFAENLRSDFDTTRGFFSQPLRESASTLVGGVQKPFEYDALKTERGRFDKDVSDAAEALGIKPTLEKDTSLFMPRTPSADAIRASQNYADKIAAGATDTQALSELQKELTPSVLQRFGLPAALGLTAMTVLSDDEEEDDELEPFETVDSDQFKVANLDPMKFMPTMKDIQVPYVGLEDGGEVVPNKYKGFSKLPEKVQQKISPELAEKYAQGGVVQSLFALSDSAKNMAGNLQRQIGSMGSSGSGITGFPSIGPNMPMAQPMTPTQDMPLTRPRPLASGSSQFLTADFGSPSSYPDGIVPDQFKNLGMNQQNALSQIQGLGGIANVFGYKDGGEVDFFPRRTGGIGPGEGSGTKDDVPAMLMDGEFVMTRDAVKAAGGGNINKGIDNMYGLMRNLEARA